MFITSVIRRCWLSDKEGCLLMCGSNVSVPPLKDILEGLARSFSLQFGSLNRNKSCCYSCIFVYVCIHLLHFWLFSMSVFELYMSHDTLTNEKNSVNKDSNK